MYRCGYGTDPGEKKFYINFKQGRKGFFETKKTFLGLGAISMATGEEVLLFLTTGY